ncbi:MAG: hypothetical protein IT441_05070 [Phycisphaeraceae bacterium]|nr:hypothetical protein [Phycisphaeraceae bacterium]
MSVLTKALVVVVTVLSVLLVALVVPFVANQQQYKKQLDEARQAEVAASTRARIAQQQADNAQEARAALVNQYETAAQNLAATLARLHTQLSEAQAAVAGQAAELAQAKADQSRLAATNQQIAGMLDATRSELTERRQKMVDLELRLIESNDRVNQLTSQMETADVSIRRLREDLAQRDQTISDYEARIAKLPQDVRDQMLAQITTAAGPFMPQTAIYGQVSRVDNLAGDTFVQLDIGQRDNVAQNMKFVIYRGEQFLGTLVVTLVDQDSAVGRVTLQQGPIKNGDSVRTGGL